MSYQIGFQHVVLGRNTSVSYSACLHGDKQSLVVCCVYVCVCVGVGGGAGG